ncbi:hypothetical protein AXG93_4225s1490 [Marchantia polymorpha subsp. ruderalis]|uniref:Uncharacterized protein n=1 Tax=Marchantia polymorpha subsp. ruderalis TaxID=1480154 RepID=A0A176WSN9_MARPO|nr:hypothetical protein AXG93_4225s1490 [Marchantia polymorpha subsp. ruderalis]
MGEWPSEDKRRREASGGQGERAPRAARARSKEGGREGREGTTSAPTRTKKDALRATRCTVLPSRSLWPPSSPPPPALRVAPHGASSNGLWNREASRFVVPLERIGELRNLALRLSVTKNDLIGFPSSSALLDVECFEWCESHLSSRPVPSRLVSQSFQFKHQKGADQSSADIEENSTRRSAPIRANVGLPRPLGGTEADLGAVGGEMEGDGRSGRASCRSRF